MAVFINGISGIILPSGAANAPIIRGDDPDTGIFFPASGQVAITVNGTNQVTFTSTGASFTGNISFSGSPVLTSGDIGVSVQPYNATLLTSGNIGVSVQAYDADLAAVAGLSTSGLINRTGAGTAATVTVPIGDLVGTSATQTLTAKTLTDPAIIGTILEDVFTITDGAAFEIDPGNGSVQLITLGASRTPKATNMVAGESITLMVDDGSAYTLTWSDATFGGSGVVWKTNAGVAPTLNTTGYTVIVLWKVSTQVYGARVGDA
jgi:hypothetical protein